MRRAMKTTKPKNKTWRTAELFDARFYDSRWPVCGQRMVWAVVGRRASVPQSSRQNSVCAALTGTAMAFGKSPDHTRSPTGSPEIGALFFGVKTRTIVHLAASVGSVYVDCIQGGQLHRLGQRGATRPCDDTVGTAITPGCGIAIMEMKMAKKTGLLTIVF